MLSHPSWVRGLKLDAATTKRNLNKSHPSWVRGLKHLVSIFMFHYAVAPLVGAWIETVTSVMGVFSSGVAPLVGAWIETISYTLNVSGQESHPSWVRGLKLVLLFLFCMRCSRTPRGCVD